ncbi:hypothetical protein H0W26_05790 [Candidatus Dependentiae bacterium]|nr:hypothetical protein [Candidatus Dependentiae bacterium]
MKTIRFFFLPLLVVSFIEAVLPEGTLYLKNLDPNETKGLLTVSSYPPSLKRSSFPEGSIQIMQADVGKRGYEITAPGIYYLGENIRFSTTSSTMDAITIKASNVTLDLNGYRIKQIHPKKNNSGICVSSNLDTVTVINGFIENFGALGIRVLGGSSNLSFASLSILRCGEEATSACLNRLEDSQCFAGGIAFEGTTGDNGSVGVTKVRIQDVFIRLPNLSGKKVTGSPLPVIVAGIAGTFITSMSLTNIGIHFSLSTSRDTALEGNSDDGVSILCNGICLRSCSLVEIESFDSLVDSNWLFPVTSLYCDNLFNSSLKDARMTFPIDSEGFDFLLNQPAYLVGPLKKESFGMFSARSSGIPARGVYVTNCGNFLFENVSAVRSSAFEIRESTIKEFFIKSELITATKVSCIDKAKEIASRQWY